MSEYQAQMTGEVNISGLSELLKAMKELPKAIEEKCLKIAVMTGGNIIKRAAADLCQRRTGLTAKAVRIGFNRQESGHGKVVYHVFVSRKVRLVYPYNKETGRTDRYGGKLIDPFWWHILEFGSVKMGHKSFLRPAFDAHNREAAEVIKGKLKERIEIEAARLGKS
jgi:HK97 gp10 family phage protein